MHRTEETRKGRDVGRTLVHLSNHYSTCFNAHTENSRRELVEVFLSSLNESHVRDVI